MTQDWTRRTAAELGEAIAAGQTTSEEVTTAHLDRIAAVDGTAGSGVHAFLHVAREEAVERARAVDERIAAGERIGPLAGVPIAVKDVVATKGLPTTVGSRILEGWVPPYDATLVTRLKEAGLVVLGKTNMDEFAMGSSTEFSAYGPTRNPWDLGRIPGGSGGGSAAAVAAFEAPLAIGTDTGGSIRQPAAVTGTVGVKPTYGGVSRYGLVALASSLDQAGPCTRTVLDAALLHRGHRRARPDGLHLAARPARQRRLRRADHARRAGGGGPRGRAGRPVRRPRRGGPRARRRGLPARRPGPVLRGGRAAHRRRRRGGRGVVPQLRARPRRLLPDPAERGVVEPGQVRRHAVRPAGRPADGDVTAERVMSATRAAGFGDEVKRRIILGTYALSSGYYDAYYGSAQKVRTLVQRDFAAAFDQVDVLVSPTAPTTAFRFGDKLDDPMAMYLNDVATIPANLAGVPGLSLPSGLADEDGLPAGIQLLAPARGDARLYRVGAALESLLTARWGGPLLDRSPDLVEAAR